MGLAGSAPLAFEGFLSTHLLPIFASSALTFFFCAGVFDQDVPDVVLTRHPHLYVRGRLSLAYKRYSFWLNMADALYQSLVIFFFALGAYSESDVGIWEFGTVICTECLAVMSLHLAIETKSWVREKVG